MNHLSLKDWDRLLVKLSWAYEGVVSPEFQDEVSPHYGQSIFLIEEGAVTISTPEGRIKATAGSWVFPRQGKRHQKFDPGTRLLSIHLDFHWPGGMPFFEWDPALVVPTAEFPLWETRARALVTFIEREFGDVRWELRNREVDLLTWRQLQRYFSAWFDLVLRCLTERGHRPAHLVSLDSRLLAGIEFLNHQPFTVPYREQEVAAYAGLSVSQWNRLFRKQFSMTPRGFYDQRKLDSALERVRAGGLLKEVAFDLGFRSMPHFSAWFHRKTSFTPSEFRERSLASEK